MERIAAEFGEGKSLYDVLEIPSTASSSEVKKAYFKIALKCHPDKCPGDPSAKARFQALSMVHSVLSDPERRALYDETGEVAEEDGVIKSSEDTWYEYWRTLFPRITVADIESFSSKYQGSDEEREDVIDAYKKCQGKMSDIIDSVILASEADVDRFREIIELAIGREDVPDFAIFRKERKARGSSKSKGKRRVKEATEAEELASMLKQRHQGRMETALATHREKQFNNMVSSLEERYGGKKARGPRRKRTNKGVEESKETQDMPEIDDDEFQRIQQKMLKERSKR